MIAWHYTCGTRAVDILVSGVLKPTDAFVPPNEKPILWFSVAPFWEQTANKMIAMDGKAICLSMEGTALYGGGLYRFGFPVERLVRWPDIGKRARCRAEDRKNMMKAARAQGADPKNWHGTMNAIALEDISSFQTLRGFRSWVPADANALKALGTTEMPEVPAVEREQLIVDATRVYLERHPGKATINGALDRACVNYIRHELTDYDSRIKDLTSREELILFTRCGYYSAIAKAYPWLREECNRQLVHRRQVYER
jgi:hypothetical protein